ncbi:MAG: carboxypeptidase-like regulatory domain-containing protein [Planctomycetota bacterium]
MRIEATRFRPLVALLVASLATPVAAVETAGKPERPTTDDVALTKEGLFAGQLVDPQGAPLADAKVRLFDASGKPVEGTTNELGQFAYRGVSSGLYYLQAGDAVQAVRVWPHKIAPPSAKKGVLLISKEETVRGQYAPPSGLNAFVKRSKRLLSNPLAVTAIVATAVAVPVAVHNADDGS